MYFFATNFAIFFSFNPFNINFCYFINYVFSVLYIIYTELNKEWWWGGKNSKLTKHTPDHKKYWEKKLWGFEREHFLHMCNSSKERGRERKKESTIFFLFLLLSENDARKNLDSLFHLGSNIILINTSKFAIPILGIQKPML